MLPLFQHEATKEIFVVHYASAADRKRARKGAQRGVRQVKVPVRFQPIKRKPREELWAQRKREAVR